VQEARLLMMNGADITLANKEKFTPIDLAPANVQMILREI